MAREDILATAGLDTSSFDKSAKGMDQTLKAVDVSTKRSGRSMQNFGFQISDVAVQAEMGTDALRILGQQGSQLLGGFGAKGAIAGAVLAVGAGLTGWALGINEANKALEETGKRLEKAKDDVQDLVKSFDASRARTLGNLIEVIDGKDAAERAKVKAEFEEDSAKFAAKAAESAEQKAKAERELTALLDRQRKSSEFIGVHDATHDERITALRKEIDTLASAERLADQNRLQREREYNSEVMKLDKEAADAHAKEKAKVLEKDEKARKKALDDQADDARNIGKILEQAAKKALDEEKKRQKDLDREHDEMHRKILGRVKKEENAKKAAAAKEKKLAEDVARAQKEANDKTADAFDERVRQKLLTPSERRKERRDQGKMDKAARTVESQDRVRAQNRARGAYGQRSVSQISDAETAKSRAAFVKRNAPKITAANITAETLTVTTVKPK